ncbi:hypothetical protein IGI04_029657, partial [Brassica rapa subsp. trilocularis]
SSLPILTTGQRNEVQNLSQNLPSAALDIAREEIREVMIQYSSCPDPTESAARKTRLRQAEEQGELEEAAAQLVRNSIEMQRMDITEERVEVTPERIPALQRLGQGSEPRSALHRLGPHENSTPRSVQPTIRKKTASQGAKRLTPSSLAPMGAGIRKRKVAKAAPSPRHRSSNLSKTIPRNEENNPKNKTTKAGPTLSDAREWANAQTPKPVKSLKPVAIIEQTQRRSEQRQVFTDAAWNSSTAEAGLGWIIEDGTSFTHHSATSAFVDSPLLAEALAVLTAMNFALSNGIDSIAVLSDSQVLINTIKKKIMKLEIFGVLSDIYCLTTSFKSISFNFIPRLENVRLSDRTDQTDLAVPCAFRLELRLEPRPDDRTTARLLRPTRHSKTHCRARRSLGREEIEDGHAFLSGGPSGQSRKRPYLFHPTHSFFLGWLALDRGYIKSHSASLDDPFNPSQFQKCRLPSRIISNTQLK